jgi:hypothetical protein
MTYADDVVIMRRKLQDAEEVFTYITGRTNKQDGIKNKWEKDRIYDTTTKAVH